MDNEYIEIIKLVGAVSVQLLTLIIVYKKLDKKVEQAKEETKFTVDASVQKLNGTLTAVIHSFDRPHWVKMYVEGRNGPEFRMLEINPSYSELFGISRQKYIGKTDLEAGWSVEQSQIFLEHDLMVWASGEPASFTEEIAGVPLRFRKYRIESPDGKLKGVAGYCVDDPETVMTTIEKISGNEAGK